MTSRLLPIAQNSDLVTFRIEVDGQALPQHVSVYAIEVTSEANRVPNACICLADGDASSGEWPVSTEAFFEPGNEISILAGYHSEEEEIFSGIVVSQTLRVRKRRLELEVRCKDKTIALTTTRKCRHFTDATDSDAVTEILQEHEIAGDIAATGTTHTDLVQYDSTDWDFIVMRMESNGLICFADREGFHASEPGVDSNPVATLHLGANVIEFDADIDARRQIGAVTTRSWSPADQGAAVGEAADPAWTTAGDFEANDLANSVGAASQELCHSGSLTSDELQSWSDAVLLRSRMAMIRGRARVQGFAAARPGAVVKLAGFGDRFNGPVWISAVRQEIGGGNWLSDIELGMPEEWHAERYMTARPPANGLLPPVSGLHTGIVAALEGDPEGEARIRVKIPSVDLESEGLWARVGTLDAGASRGTFFLPEIDDEVVVGFLNDDPRHPVILGMLHSSAHAPPEEASDDNPIKGFYSRSGMRIQFDEETTKLTIDTPGGRVFVFDDDAGEISLTDSNRNKMVMSASGINIESAGDLILKASGNVTLEGGANVDVKARAQLKSEGSAGAEISSNGVTVVKGSLVQIN